MRISAHCRLVCVAAALFLWGAKPSLAQSHEQPVTSAVPTPVVPASSHVFLVVLENGSYSTVTNNADPTHFMPWMIGLGNTYAHSTNYITNSGGSLLAYLWLSSGFCHSDTSTTADCPKTIPPGVTPVNRFGCSGGSCVSAITDDNIYREMVADNISWTLYFESLPSVGYMGGQVGNYDPHHNPAKWYSDVINSTAFQQHMVPFTQFPTDLASNQLPKYTLIIPDDSHDAHDGTPQAADQWLQTNVGPLLNQPFFQPGGDGVLIITFDNQDDDGSGQVYWTIIGPKIKRGYVSNTFLQHQDTLLTVLHALGIAARPGYTSIANGMAEFFIQPQLTVTKPGSGTGTVTSNDGSINCGATCSANFNDGTAVTLTATPAAGSIFAGWGGACSGTTTCSVTMNAAQAVTATFTQTFVLTVTRQGAGTGTVTSNVGSINCGATCSATYNSGTAVTLTATPAAGSAFTGWAGACSGTQTCSVTMSAAQTVTATFTPTFVLTVTPQGTGTGTVASNVGSINCGATCSATYNSGTPVTLTATPAAGSVFVGWGGACSGTTTCTVTMNAAQSVSATFSPPFGLTVTKQGAGTGTVTSNVGGINCGATCLATFANGTVVTLTATPATGSAFAGWGGACSGTQTCVVTMNSALTVSATFSPTFALTITKQGTGTGTVTSSDGSLNCGLTCSANFTNGTTITLTATPTPASGSTFAGWGGACAGTQTCTLTINSAQSASASFTQTGPLGLRFVPATPCRIADTRLANGPFGGPFVSGQTSRSITIPSSACNIPATAQAYSLNVTVVPHGPLGYLTTFPCGQSQPLVSTLNSDGRIKAVAAIIPAGSNGAVCFFASNDTDLVLDINGYFVAAATTGSLDFYPVTQCRLADTRMPSGAMGGPSLTAGVARNFAVPSGGCNVPATAQAYSLNMTAVPKGPLGFVTAWPTGQTQPTVSTLNAPTGVTTANAAVVPAGANGAISVFASNNSDLVIDVNGYFAPPAPGGLAFYSMAPCRVLDTRNPGSQQFAGTLSVSVVGSGCGAPTSAQSYVLNATVVPPAQLGFLTLWPQGATQPAVSTLNAVDGAITSNMAIVPPANGSVNVFSTDLTHLVLDISGYFAP
jgi:phosphoesterase family protein/List-Bact-rpt repeat protein